MAKVKATFGAAVMLVIFYLVTAFVVWDFDPADWPMVARVLCGFIGTWIAGMVWLAISGLLA